LISSAEDQSFIALIDDDAHSSYLLTRMLRSQDAPAVQYLGGATEGEVAITVLLADVTANWPDLLIIDLKAHSGANLEFLHRNHTLLRQKGIPVAVMTPPSDREARETLHRAGASAVFFRQSELDAYRHEAAAIVSFWARHQRLDAVGM
jgi:DNA-binding NarL/FixJ family response regulator